MLAADNCTQYTKSLGIYDAKSVVCDVDKCAPVRYNVSTFNRRYGIMTAFSTAKSGYCTFSAAAYTSALKLENLDTARVAVSILLSPIISVRRT